MSILRTMRRLNYVLAAMFILMYFFSKNNSVALGPGVKAKDAPYQERIRDSASFEFKDHQITPLAEFSIKAKVLSRKDYNWGRSSDLSPVDLALGWGNMSDEAVLKSIKIESARWLINMFLCKYAMADEPEYL